MIDTLIMVAALVAAIFWIGLQQRMLTTTTKRLEKVEKRLHSAKLTLTTTKDENMDHKAEIMFLKNVLFDVAKGEAHVWIEDDELRAARKPVGGTQVH